MDEIAKKDWVAPVLEEVPMIDTASKGTDSNESMSMMMVTAS